MTHKRIFPLILSTIPALLILITMGVAINTASAAISGEGNHEELLAVDVAGDPVCPVGTIAYWQLEESAEPYLDSYGDHDGVVAGEAPVQTAGKFGNGQEFDYINDEEPPQTINPGIEVPSDPAFDWGASDSFSIEAWVKPEVDACLTHSRVVIGRDDHTGSDTLGGIQWWVGCASISGKATFQLDDSNRVRRTVMHNTSITDGAWHHVVAVRDGTAGNNIIYVDNIAKSITANTYTGDFTAVADANVTIGWIDHREDPLNIHRFAGVIDEVVIYDRALSPEEIAFHYSGGVGGVAHPYCNASPVITPVSNQTNDEGDTITPLDINATDPEGIGLVYNDNGTLPDGLSIHSSTGVISGTLTYTSDGVHPVTITVTDVGLPAAYDELAFTWTVNNKNGPPQVTNPGNKTSAEGQTISPLTIIAPDPDGDPRTFSATSLPPGLGINPTTGVISGTVGYNAFKGSAYAVQVSVSDGINPPATVSFTWNITETNRPPQVTDPGDQNDPEGETVSVLVNASDPDGNNLTFGVTGLPAGLSFTAVDGDTIQISGTISYAAFTGAPYTVTVTATDNGNPNLSGSVQFTWTVSDVNEGPLLVFLPVVSKQPEN